MGKMNIPRVKTVKVNNLGTARARNFGARFAKGGLLIFSDAHNLFPKFWLENILNVEKEEEFDILAPGIGVDKNCPNNDSDAVGYGQYLNEKAEPKWLVQKPTSFSEIPIAAGGCTIFKKEVFRKIEGYENNFLNWGYEDIEISLKAWLFGFKIKIFPDLVVEHFFRPRTPYKIEQTDYQYNYYRTAILHFNQSRLEKMKKIITERFVKYGMNPQKSFKIMEKYLQEAKTEEKQNRYLEIRKYSDDWFFSKFDLTF